MTEEEFKIITSIVLTADEGCAHCVNELLSKLTKALPKYDWYGMAKVTEEWT